MFCERCGIGNDDDDAFCVGCGAALPPAPAPSVAPSPPIPSGVTAPIGSPTPLNSREQEPAHGVGPAWDEKVNDSSPDRMSTWRTPKMIVGGLLAVAALIFVASKVLGGGDASTSSSSNDLAIPTKQPEDRWTADIDEFAGAAGTSASVFAVSGYANADLISLDTATGEERWSVNLDGYLDSGDGDGASLYAIANDVLTATFDGENRTLTYWRGSDGEEVWNERLDVSDYITVEDNQIFLSDESSIEVLDAATGKSMNRIRHRDGVRYGLDDLSVRDNDSVQRYRWAGLASVGDPVEIDDDVTDFVFLGDRLLTANNGDLALLDKAGEEIWSDNAPFDSIYSMRAVDSSTLIISGDDEVAAFKTVDNGLEQLWDSEGYGFNLVGAGPKFVIVYTNDGSEIYNLATGERIMRSDGGITAGNNGLLSIEGDTVEAFSLDGKRMWSLDYDGAVELLDGQLLVSESSGSDGDAELTLYR